MESLIGQTLGQYKIIELIGAGGMAVVYKAFQASLNRFVAVKVLPPGHAPDSRFVRRFSREAQVAAFLDHPNIVPIYDFGQQGDVRYLVMKHITAGSLANKLGQPLPLMEVLSLIEPVAGALDEAHAHGIVHCDVTPRNILLDQRDWPYLTDFGLSRLVDTAPPAEDSAEPASTHPAHSDLFVLGEVVFEMLTKPRYEGTPAYMSPEQGRGLPVDARTDVYALGAILFEMLTGRVLYQAETDMAIVLKQITAPPPQPHLYNPDLPDSLEPVLLKALAKDPGERFASAAELTRALHQVLPETAPNISAGLAVSTGLKAAISASANLPAEPPRFSFTPGLVSSQTIGPSWLPLITVAGVVTAILVCALIAWLIHLF